MKRLFSLLVVFSFLLSATMYSCGDDNDLFPSSFYNFEVTSIRVDNRNVDLRSFAQIFNVSLNPRPLAAISFSRPVASVIDSLSDHLSLTFNNNRSKLQVDFTLRQGSNDSMVYMYLPAGASLERSRSYEITLRRGLSVEIAGNKYSLNRSYYVNFFTAAKNNNTNLSVNYMGKNIVASDASVFTIDAGDVGKFPAAIFLQLRVEDPLSTVQEGNNKLTSAIDGLIDYTFDVKKENNERRFTVIAEDGSRKQYTIAVNASSSQYRATQVQYTVIFNTNGGSFVNAQTINRGDEVRHPLSPTKTDSVFEKWYIDANLTTAYNFGTAVTSDMTLYAKWAARPLTSSDTATVTFNTNGGSSLSSVKTRKGEAISRPTSPTRSHFTFSDWYSDADLTTPYDFDTTITSNTTLYAKWDTIKYTVSFNSNGGSRISSQIIHSGDTVRHPLSPTKTDSVFDKWYSDVSLMTAYNFVMAVTSDMTLYAKWAARPLTSSDTVTVTFNTNGGSSLSSVKTRKGEAISRPTNPTRSHFTFNDWYIDAGLTTPYDFGTTITSNATLYAKWDTLKYTVSFNSNGGSGISSQIIHSGDTVRHPLSPTKTDSVFEKWYSNASLTTAYDFGTAVSSDMTLYAKWAARPLTSSDTATVTFNTNGGSSLSSVKTRKGEAISRPTNPTRIHFTFNNWYSDASLTTPYDFGTTITSNATLYAQWDTLKYTVSFNSNGGSGISSQIIHSGDTVRYPLSPTKTDSVFERWYIDANLTMAYDFGMTVSSDMTLYAKWAARPLTSSDTATVTFNTNGGSSLSSVKTRKGETVARPTNPTRSHFTFNDWYIDADLTTPYDFGTTITSNATLYAKWDTLKYTITFNSNSGSSVGSQTIKSGDTAVRPTNPTRTHYTFNDWYSDAGLTTTYDFGTTIMSNATLYAKWDTLKYTVAFNSNGGGSVNAQIIHSGDTVRYPLSPTKTDSVFDKWYSDVSLMTAYDFGMTVSSDMTLYAKWAARPLTSSDTATVMFNTNGGSSLSSVKTRKGKTVARPTNPTRSHFTFNNWYSNSSLTTAYNFSSAVTSDMTLYAQWDTVKYTVTFNSNSGSSVGSQTIKSGDTAVRPTNPTRTHYTFNDWYSNSSLTTAYNFSSAVTSDMTLYAKWDMVKYTITFNSNSGSSVGSQTIKSGDTAFRPTNPTRSHFTFNNWYSNSSLTTAYNFSSAVTSDMMLYAKWDTIKYTVTLNSNSGSLVGSQTIKSGDTAVRPTNPTRTHYTFNDWYSDADLTTIYDFGTSVSSDMTLYAQWDTVKYTVTFNSNSGSAVDTQRVKSGGSAVRPTNPTRSHFTFNNWYSNSSLTNAYNFSSAVTSDMTLYAQWDTVKYTVTFNSDGGSSIPSQQVTSGAKATLPSPNSTKGGLYLMGWFTKANAHLNDSFSFSGAIASDTTIYAKWINLFGKIVLSGKIPKDIFQYDDPLVNETLGNGNYQTGASIVVKHVKYGGDDNNDGSSWSKAQATVSKALSDISDASSSKMYVALIAASPNEYAAGASMSMKNNTAIIGGFAAENDFDYFMSKTNTTMLSGNGSYRVFDNSSLDLSSLLYGVKIIKGNEIEGAGMFNKAASVSVTNVIFSENRGQLNSALLNAEGSNGIFKNTLFINNYTDDGSAVRVNNSKPIFANSIFAKNKSAEVSNSFAPNVFLSTNSSAIFINTNFSENGQAGNFHTGDGLFIDDLCHCFPIVVNSLFSSPDNNAYPQTIFLGAAQNAAAGVNDYNNFFIYGGYVYQHIHNGQNFSIYPLRQSEPPYVIIEGMTYASPSLGAIGANGGFIPTMSIPKTSSAVNLGLYVKASSLGSENILYFSEDKISWFNLDDKGRHAPVVPPADAKDLTDTDGRGYKRVDRPDAGAYEADGIPVPFY